MLIQFIAGFAAYAVLLVLSQRILASTEAGTGLQVILTLLPMLAALVIGWSVLGVIRRLDEMQRKIQIEALALAFAGTALITFGYGFLEGVGLPKLSMFTVWPLMAVLWIVGLVVGRARH
jgi:peptidoglycan/LPS O-acetylase OafA/YrhL